MANHLNMNAQMYFNDPSYASSQREWAHRKYLELQRQVEELDREFGFSMQTGVFNDPRHHAILITAVREVAESDENVKTNMPVWRRVMEVLMYPDKAIGKVLGTANTPPLYPAPPSYNTKYFAPKYTEAYDDQILANLKVSMSIVNPTTNLLITNTGA